MISMMIRKRMFPKKGLDIKIKTGRNQTTSQEGKTLGISLMMMKIKREEELREEEEVVEIEYTSQCLVKMILINLFQETTVGEMILI